MLDLLFPTRCAICDRVGAAVCPSCATSLRVAGPVPPPPALDSCAALLVYEGSARRLVSGLKYRNHRAALPRLGAALAALAPPQVDEVVWAPTSSARRRARGYDQAALLAHAIARARGIPCTRRLTRTSSSPQTGRALAARLAGPTFALVARPPPRLLLVDDVVTSGATLSAAARALRAGGAREVHGLVLARTPAPEERT